MSTKLYWCLLFSFLHVSFITSSKIQVFNHQSMHEKLTQYYKKQLLQTCLSCRTDERWCKLHNIVKLAHWAADLPKNLRSSKTLEICIQCIPSEQHVLLTCRHDLNFVFIGGLIIVSENTSNYAWCFHNVICVSWSLPHRCFGTCTTSEFFNVSSLMCRFVHVPVPKANVSLLAVLPIYRWQVPIAWAIIFKVHWKILNKPVHKGPTRKLVHLILTF